MKTPTPPRHLGKHGRELFKRLAADYAITDSGGIALLTTGCEALDRIREAQAAIKSDGAVILDRYGCPKNHPACTLERDARNQFLQAIKALQLDVEDSKGLPGRPMGS